ncbi:hypothetical protein BDV32DRAFT_131073 [Aspergillus pseudonomiae]|nr:hypothetical protein BDV32DRAFT_131073 [Aspergillus pseudonomiae]
MIALCTLSRQTLPAVSSFIIPSFLLVLCDCPFSSSNPMISSKLIFEDSGLFVRFMKAKNDAGDRGERTTQGAWRQTGGESAPTATNSIAPTQVCPKRVFLE